MVFNQFWRQHVHVSSGLELILVLQGELTVVAGRLAVTAQTNGLILIPSNIRHRDEFTPGEEVNVFFCSTAWTHEKQLFKKLRRKLQPFVLPDCNSDILRIFRELRGDLARNIFMDPLVAGARIMTILTLILRDGRPKNQPNWQEQKSRTAKLLQQAKQYIETHYSQPISLNDVAQALHVSPSHLSHVFSRANGCTLFAFLTKIRMEKARGLLNDGRHNVSEAAYATGYEDPCYFSRVFQRYFGYAPIELIHNPKKASLLMQSAH